jgi:hypothetical protein
MEQWVGNVYYRFGTWMQTPDPVRHTRFHIEFRPRFDGDAPLHNANFTDDWRRFEREVATLRDLIDGHRQQCPLGC